jgi:hypothetical protein
MISRREWLRVSVAGAAVAAFARRLPALPPKPVTVSVYKSAACGCCGQWVEHMKRSGFTVETHDVDDVKLPEIKDTAGIPASLRSCHVAMAGAYVFEGHVPADLVSKVLTKRPKLRGLAVPGMPVGSPGMEMGARKDRYDVMAFTTSGKTWVYASR